ncbi:nickel pincer cofactor biosynthesis protein LarC [Halomicrobium katesii]|uniref:nickel pincer cofactor biosynthesis protein LarC n=1 Tax=Halomicrobium katesii TaxID=437163 RepID=UPI00036D507A|nr:nickel pincer cofactor biosynthesis protein LarC [Halomicrobium katesii]
MRTLAFDGRMGASGDMLLAALLAVGADRDALAPVEDALPIRYDVSETVERGIGATSVAVVLTDADETETDGTDADTQIPSKVPGHDHSHDHADDSHDHTHGGTAAEGHGPSRSLGEVREIVGEMTLPDGVERDALAIFEILGEAEAAVHDTTLDEMHFHEVGADDAIADVVGVCLLLDDLGVERVVTTPLSAGGGTVEMSHGTYPVPGPAVVEIAERADWSLAGGPVDAELLTPTGASILAHVADGVDALPELAVEASGYGAGGYDFENRPNVLRSIVGDGGGGLRRDEITVLETNLDDTTPEVLGSLQERLQDAGARDVSILPATMKKSRPGHLVKVVCKPADSQRVARRLAEETGTLGVRAHGAGHRWIADREIVTATVEIDGDAYEIDVKVATDSEGTVFDVSGEYDDAAGVADETGLPVREVLRRAEDALR